MEVVAEQLYLLISFYKRKSDGKSVNFSSKQSIDNVKAFKSIDSSMRIWSLSAYTTPKHFPFVEFSCLIL